MRDIAPNRVERLQLWALFLLIVASPLPLAGNRVWAISLLGELTGCLLIWTVWQQSGQGLVWRSARIPLVLMGFWIALLVLQLLPLQEGRAITIDPYSTRLYLAKACILSAIFWLVMVVIKTRQDLIWLARVVVFSGLFQAMLAVVLMAGGITLQLFFVTLDSPRAHGTFVSPNNFAGYMELTLAMGIGLMIATLQPVSVVNWRRRLHGWLAVLLSGKAMLRVALIIMVVGLVASRSRMGNAAFFVSLLATTALMLPRAGGSIRRSLIVFISSVILLDVLIIGSVVGVEKVVQRIESTHLKGATAQAGREQSVEERIEAVIPALRIVQDHPWLGTGGGTFHLEFLHYQPGEVRGYFEHPHNDFVEFASDTGLTGLLILSAMVLHSLWLSFSLMRVDSFTLGMVFASVMGMTSLLIHGAVDFNFQIPANAMLFLILLSLPYLQLKAGLKNY